MSDSYSIKLSGKAELEAPLEIGHNFHVELEGSITGENINDNDDGTKSHSYLFRPVRVEVIKETGERLRAKDTRSRSQQLRAMIFRDWRNGNFSETFEDYYDRIMLDVMQKL